MAPERHQRCAIVQHHCSRAHSWSRPDRVGGQSLRPIEPQQRRHYAQPRRRKTHVFGKRRSAPASRTARGPGGQQTSSGGFSRPLLLRAIPCSAARPARCGQGRRHVTALKSREASAERGGCDPHARRVFLGQPLLHISPHFVGDRRKRQTSEEAPTCSDTAKRTSYA